MPQRAQVLSVDKARHGLPKQSHLAAELRAAIANEEVQAKGDALAEAKAAVEPLGYQAGGLFAGEHRSANSRSAWPQFPYKRPSVTGA